MKTILKYSVISMLTFLISLVTVLINDGQITIYKNMGSSDDIIWGGSVIQELRKEYLPKANATDYGNGIVSILEKDRVSIDNCNNLNQGELNDYFNDYRNSGYTADNSCSIVAITNVVEFYSNFGNDQNYHYYNRGKNLIFSDLLEVSYAKGWSNNESGTPDTKHNEVLSAGFNQNYGRYKGDNDWWGIRAKIRNRVTSSIPALFSLTNHTVVGVGKSVFEIKYREKYNKLPWKTSNRDVTKTVEFFIINEGWGWNQKSYIKSSLIEGMQSMQMLTRVERK